MKDIKKKIIEIFEPLLTEQRKILQSSQTHSHEMDKTENDVKNLVNKIAKDIFKDLDAVGSDKGKIDLPYPKDGFNFSTEFFQAVVDQEHNINLYVSIPKKGNVNNTITINSSNPSELEIKEDKVKIKQYLDKKNKPVEGLGFATISVFGRRIGVCEEITATLKNNTTMALAEVISKRKINPSPKPRKKKFGMFNGWKFDHRDEPRERSFFDESDKKIGVFSKHPTIKPYCDEEGILKNNASAQVMLAEIVCKTVLEKFAEEANKRGLFPALDTENNEKNIKILFNRFDLKYSSSLHKLIVEKIKHEKIKSWAE